MFWIFLWFCLSAFVIGAFAWTTRILFEQKRAWLAYARKYNLTYDRGPFFGSPSVSGVIGRHRITLFSEEQAAPDARGRRFRTVIELMRPSGLPVRGAIGCRDMVPVIEGAQMETDVVPDSPDWKSEWRARSDDKTMMKAYLTPERIKAAATLFNHKNASAIYIFDAEDALLRYDTGNPLHDPARLDKLVKMMTGISDAFLVQKGETLPRRSKKQDAEPEREEADAQPDSEPK